MRKGCLILIIGIFLFNSSCGIIHNSTVRYDYIDKVGSKLYNCIENYYIANLEFPQTVDCLIEFLGGSINELNNEKCGLFAKYLNLNEESEYMYEDVLFFLMKNRNNISINWGDNKFILSYKQKRMEFNLDYCNDKNELFGSLAARRCLTYDISGKLTKEDYQEDFSQLCKSVKEMHYKNYLNEQVRDTTIYLLLRYNKRDGLYSVCPEKMNIINNSYLKELSFALDTFTNKRNVDMIQFVFSIRD